MTLRSLLSALGNRLNWRPVAFHPQPRGDSPPIGLGGFIASAYFTLSAWLKFLDPQPPISVLVGDFSLAHSTSRVVVAGLVVTELIVAWLLFSGHRLGQVLGCALLVMFSVGIAWQLWIGSSRTCGCGIVIPASSSRVEKALALTRNFGLLVLIWLDGRYRGLWLWTSHNQVQSEELP